MFLSCLMWSAWGFEFFSMKPIFHVGKPSCHPHTSIRKPQSAPKSFLCYSHLFSQALSDFPVFKPAIISPCKPVLACSYGYAQTSLKQQRFILSQFHSWYHWAETLGLARPPSDTKGVDILLVIQILVTSIAWLVTSSLQRLPHSGLLLYHP